MTAHCTGPRKVAYCELYDHGDATFTLNVKPQEPGKHLLTIKYGGQHVTGSPFALKVAGAPDASKVYTIEYTYSRLIHELLFFEERKKLQQLQIC